MFRSSLDKFDAGVITGYVDMAGGVGGEAAGEGGEVREGCGQREFEEGDEGIDRERWA